MKQSKSEGWNKARVKNGTKQENTLKGWNILGQKTGKVRTYMIEKEEQGEQNKKRIKN